MPFSALYGRIIDLRARLYRAGYLRSGSLGAPTISIGNITVGGTGKTPLVIWLAGFLADRGENVCVISRGYRRSEPKRRVLVSDGRSILADAVTGGDEPLEIARRLLGKAIVIADADRVGAARWAMEKYSPTVFVLDDAFQHLAAKRDLDIVVIDGTNAFGNRRTLPSGILREEISSLKRADLIVISRANLSDTESLKRLRAQIAAVTDCPVLASHNEINRLTEVGSGAEIAAADESFFAFCAIGNPANFFDQLTRDGFRIAGTKAFPDHHYFTTSDFSEIDSAARSAGATALLTTAKDATKISPEMITMPCFVAENRLVFDDEQLLVRTVEATIAEFR